MRDNNPVVPFPHHGKPAKGIMTHRQKQVLDFIKDTLAEKGFPPTVRDIANYLKIISLNAVRRHLIALAKKGYIIVEPGKSRGIRVLDDSPPVPRHAVPLVGKIAAGPFSTAIEEVEGNMLMDPDFWGETRDLFLLRVKGNSLEPHIREGDLVVVRKQKYADIGDIVVTRVDDEATVKQFIERRGRLYIHAFNPAYKDIPVDADFEIDGLVIGLIRKYQ